MSFVDVRGLRLHYQEWSRSDGAAATSASRDVVLIHGLGSSSHIWDLVAPLLAKQRYRVLAIDQRGHGESDQPDDGYDFATVVADLAGFMDAVGLSEPAMLVGHSWGASVVLHFAVSHSDRCAGIALVDGGTGSPSERMTWEETEVRLRPPDLDGMLWTDLYRRISQRTGLDSDPRREAIGRSMFRIDADGHVTRRFRIPNHMKVVRALWEQQPAELLPLVKCPVLLLPARQSSDVSDMSSAKAASVERALQLQPLARAHWFDDTIHDVPLQRPDELAAELAAFAAESIGAGAPF